MRKSSSSNDLINVNAEFPQQHISQKETPNDDVCVSEGMTTSLPPYFHMLLRGEDASPLFPIENPSKIVLLHGFVQDHSCWLSTAARLRDQFGHSVLLIDFYGHGRSPYLKDYKDHDPKILVKQLRDAVIKIGWENDKLCIAGISMGGAVCQLYTESYPENIERILLLASSGMDEKKWIHTTDIFRKTLKIFFKVIDKCNEKIGLDWVLRKYPIRAALSKLHLVRNTPTYGVPQEGLEERLEQYPITLIWPKYDLFHSPQIRRLKKNRDDVNVMIVPWMEHMLFCMTIDYLKLHNYPHFWHEDNNAPKAKL